MTRKKEVFSINGSGLVGYQYAKGGIYTLISHHTEKITTKGSDTNLRPTTIKQLEENIGEKPLWSCIRPSS